MKTILQRISAGEHGAIRECLAEYGDLVWRLALRYLRNYADAEDATQEVFVSLWVTAQRYDPSRGPEAAWVATIAHRRLTDFSRSASARRALTGRDGPVVAFEAVCRENRWTADDGSIVAALGELSEEEREVVWLSVVAGFSHGRIGELLGVPIGTVKTRLRRAIRRLREHLVGSVDVVREGKP